MKSKHQQHKHSKKILISVGGLVVLLAAGYVGGSLYFKDKFLPNTTINGSNLSQKTVATANTDLAAKVDSDVFTLTENGQPAEEINFESLGKSVDFTSELTAMMDKQNVWTWPVSFFTKTKEEMGDFAITDAEVDAYTTKTLTPALAKLNEGRAKSSDATLVFADGTFAIQPEVDGTYLDAAKITAALKEKILAGEKTLELEDFKTPPAVKKDNADLTAKLAAAEKIANVAGNYTIKDTAIAIPQATIASWLTYTDGKVGVNTDNVRAYVADLAAQYNTSSSSMTFNSTKRGKVEIPADVQGWTIQVDDETAALSSAVLAGENFTREPVAEGSDSAAGPGDTYIEVDKENQHMWFYKDGALVLDTDVVTGKPSTPTPTGVFSVLGKDPDSVLRGTNSDGSAYAAPVSFWMPVNNNGIGIHDANWQPTFGGTWYQAHGSHGCVNTPSGMMAQLFNAVSTSTPVLIF